MSPAPLAPAPPPLPTVLHSVVLATHNPIVSGKISEINYLRVLNATQALPQGLFSMVRDFILRSGLSSRRLIYNANKPEHTVWKD